MARGDLGRDGEAAPAAPPPRPGPSRELGHRSRQPRPGVDHLDAHPSAGGVAAQTHRPAAVLDRVGEQVPARLGEPQAVAAHRGAGRLPVSAQISPRRPGHGAPGRDGVLQQVLDGNGLEAVAGAAAGPRGVQVVEREGRAAQLEVDGGQPVARRAPGTIDEVQPQPRGGERPAQLVGRAGDQLHPSREPALHQRPRAQRREGERPAEEGETGAHAATSSPSINR